MDPETKTFIKKSSEDLVPGDIIKVELNNNLKPVSNKGKSYDE